MYEAGPADQCPWLDCFLGWVDFLSKQLFKRTARINCKPSSNGWDNTWPERRGFLVAIF
jgi:hypothetical protein